MLQRIADVVDEALARSHSTLPYPTLDLVRVSSALARGMALERHVSQARVDDRVIDWAFSSFVPADSRANLSVSTGPRSATG
jgi:hypothetical protein